MDTHQRDEHTSLSRRDLIKRAAAAGAVAWTAPLVVESLTSPAGALTPGPCQPYYVKMLPSGTCYNAGPASGAGRRCGVASNSVSFPLPQGVKCGSGCGASCSGANASLTPSISYNSGTGLYTVSLQPGSWFSSALAWTLGGRYDSPSGERFTKLCTTQTSDGYYVDQGSTGYVARRVTFADNVARTLSYIYIMFCRSS